LIYEERKKRDLVLGVEGGAERALPRR